MPDLLIEIGTEEVPAGFLVPALEGWRQAAVRLLGELRLEHGDGKVYGTPRRMTLTLEQVADRQPDAVEERSGPFVAQAFDSAGNPTKAGLGFAKSCGVELAGLEREPTPKGEKLVFRKKVAGRPALEVLAARLPGLIDAIPFPKAMRWGDGEFRFARPIHWVLALLGEEVVPFTVAGIAADRVTRGHRFTHPALKYVRNLPDYFDILDRSGVEVNPDNRQGRIERDAVRAAEEMGGELIPDPALLREITWLVENPVVMAGGFDGRYLKLPPEVLIESMRAHQKYFAVQKPGTARELLPCFVAVANTPATDPAVVRAGFERVLKARLSDAEFFFREDGKIPLEKFAAKLPGVVFQAKLGNYAEKTERVAKLAGWLAERLAPGEAAVKAHAVRAAQLCKADLVTQMVGEFPKLQGIMGGEYAKLSGEAPEAAMAISDHYLPRSAEDIHNNIYPASLAGYILSLADKMDSIVGCWGVGLAPTGSADAFAIRRQTLAIIHILLVTGHPLSIPEFINQAAQQLTNKIDLPPDKLAAEVTKFFKDRLQNLMTEDLYPYDINEAVLTLWNGNVKDAQDRAGALYQFKLNHADFEPLMVAFKRVVRIIEGEPGAVDAGLFEHEAEKALYREFQRVEQAVRPLLAGRNYAEALSELAGLKPTVDRFFDGVMVNAEDAKLRRNRHALLAQVRSLFQELADFSKIVTAG